MKLYHGGYGNYIVFVVAENKVGAIAKIGEKINAPYLPITATEISDIDGYKIIATKDEGVRINANVEQKQVARPKTAPKRTGKKKGS